MWGVTFRETLQELISQACARCALQGVRLFSLTEVVGYSWSILWQRADLCSCRILEQNMVLTVEPGCYFNPYLLIPAMDDAATSSYLVYERIKDFLVNLGHVTLAHTSLLTCARHSSETAVDVRRCIGADDELCTGLWRRAAGGQCCGDSHRGAQHDKCASTHARCRGCDGRGPLAQTGSTLKPSSVRALLLLKGPQAITGGAKLLCDFLGKTDPSSFAHDFSRCG
jgi:hypothetical protein